MKQETKLVQEEAQQAQAQVHQESENAREFATVEDLLRHDAAQTQVPAGIERRLAESTKDQVAPPRPWWRRFIEG